jgi:hypothetical protein
MNFKLGDSQVTSVMIIQHNWPLQSFTKNLALNLIKKHKVVLFIDSRSLDFDLDGYNDLINAGVQVVKLDFFKVKFLNFIAHYLYRVLVKITPLIIDVKHRLVRKIITKRSGLVEYIIPIEKEALIIASKILSKTPIFYYSLELYYDKNKSSREYKHIRKKEKKSIYKVSALIIQDNFRAESYFLNNKIHKLPVVKLPVSLPICVNRVGEKEVNYWRKKFSIPGNIKVILYFGLLKKGNRGLEGFVKRFPVGGDFSLILHGYGSEKFIKSLRQLGTGKRVFISTDFVAEEKIDILIRSSDIGLCWYSRHDDNNRHTAFSSEKIALFLRNGIPIFTNFSETYGELYSKFECGVGNYHPKNLYSSSLKIISEYNKYSINAYKAFHFFYDYDKNILLAEKSIQKVLLNLHQK